MPANSPWFSIVIPTYNRGDILKKTIKGVLNQEFQSFEIIVVDDGSSDDTKKVVRSINNEKIRYFYKENEERAIARNKGIEIAIGKYITFLDSDDLIYSDYLLKAFELISNHNNPPWLHVNYEIRDDKGKLLKEAEWRTGELTTSLLTGNHLSCLGVFVKNDVLRKYMFDEDPRLIGSEDYDLWLRIGHDYPIIYTNEKGACLIQHPERSVTGFGSQKLINRIEYLISKYDRLNFFSKANFKLFKAHRYAYLALHLAIIGNIKGSFIYLFKTIGVLPSIIFHKKFYGIIKTQMRHFL